MFSLLMRSNVYLGAYSKNFDISARFLRPDLLIDSEISATWGRFQLNFSSDKLNVRHISTSVLFDLLK